MFASGSSVYLTRMADGFVGVGRDGPRGDGWCETGHVGARETGQHRKAHKEIAS